MRISDWSSDVCSSDLYIVCLEDGKKFKMLRGHLRHIHGMTPHDYQVKWGLPADYPMVAQNLSAKRRSVAKHIGLGLKGSGGGSNTRGKTWSGAGVTRVGQQLDQTGARGNSCVVVIKTR